MRTIQLNNKKYQCPTKWSDITLRQQIKVSQDASEEETFKILALVSGYCNIPIKELKTAKFSQVKGVFKHLAFLKDVELSKKPVVDFRFKGDDYTIAETLMKEEFQDWVSCETAFENHKDNIWDAIPYIVAVLAKKKGESLDSFDLEERAEYLKDIPVDIANGISVFFYQNEKLSKVISLLSLNQNQIVQQKGKEVLDTLNKQAGGAWYIRLVNGILRWYTKSLLKSWTKYFTSSQSKD